MGTESSGMHGHIRGWHVGGAVDMYPEGDKDRAAIYATAGSAGYEREAIGSVRNVDGVLVLTPSAWVIEQVRNHERAAKKEARRVARERAKLEASATETATARGHKLAAWSVPEYASLGVRSSAQCSHCGMTANADTMPAPNGTDVFGEAVALNCPTTDADVLAYCESVYMDGMTDDQTGDVDGPVGHVYRVFRFVVQTSSTGEHHLNTYEDEDAAREGFAALDKLASYDDEETI